MSNFKRLVCVFFVLLLVTACEKQPENPPPDKIAVQLKWVHQAQFAGFYVALERGYYTDENIDISFLEGGSNVDIADSINSGKAQFGVLAPEDLLIKRDQGKSLTAIAAIYRRSAVVYLSQKDSAIYRPQDFKGKTIAALGSSGSVRDFELQLNSLVKLYHLDPSQLHLIEYDPTYKGFIKGDVDVTAAYLTGGAIKLNKKGIGYNIIWPGDFGVKSYSDVLVARDSLIQEKPDLVLRFLNATLKGWREAIGDPEGAVKDTLKFAKVKDEAIQRAMMEAQIPLVHTGENHIGWMRKDVWQDMCNRLFEQKVLTKSLAADSVFTMNFLNLVYKSHPS